jgi:hypothetical protein
MRSGDRMAILRTSGGTGDLEQFTGDRRILNAALDRLQFLGGKTGPQAASAATRLTLRSALAGAHHTPGRKIVVVFSSHLLSADWDRAAKGLSAEANAAAAVVYGVDPSAGTSPALLGETGGLLTPSLSSALEAETNYYMLGFEETATDPIERPRSEPVSVKVRREGVTLRARSTAFDVAPREDFPAPVDRAIQIRRALASPFEDAGIHARLTAGFAGYKGQAAVVEVAIVIDLRNIAVLTDLKGIHHGSNRINVEARSESGSTQHAERSYDMAIAPQDYERALRNGMIYSVTLSLPSSGGWEIRAVVSDGTSDGLGSSRQFVEIPQRTDFSISGLMLRGYEAPDGNGAPADPEENAAVRSFRSGQMMQFGYVVFNALTDEAKQSRVEMTTRLYANGRVVFSSPASQIAFPAEQPNMQRTITGRLSLARDVVPGDYIMEVTVIDLLAPANAPRSTTGFIDFHLRE